MKTETQNQLNYKVNLDIDIETAKVLKEVAKKKMIENLQSEENRKEFEILSNFYFKISDTLEDY